MTAPTPGGYVSNEVLAAKLDTLTDEVRELRRELVRRDVYEAQRQADTARIAALEKQISEQAPDVSRIATLEKQISDQTSERRQVKLALLGAGAAFVFSIVRPFFG